ncbi:hypothetical protein CWM61_09405 [Klebsiella sp. K-Nf6]|nr:hypothetical protein [Klebsiella pneumoniae]PJR65045.1 hypothetical protein CWM61_09405 [Klebsiella sp. K-Nf6]
MGFLPGFTPLTPSAKTHLEDLTSGRKEPLPSQEDNCQPTVFGVITYIVNDARSRELDDSSVR